MGFRFAKVSEEEIKTAFFYPSDLVNTKTTIPLGVREGYIPRRFGLLREQGNISLFLWNWGTKLYK